MGHRFKIEQCAWPPRPHQLSNRLEPCLLHCCTAVPSPQDQLQTTTSIFSKKSSFASRSTVRTSRTAASHITSNVSGVTGLTGVAFKVGGCLRDKVY